MRALTADQNSVIQDRYTSPSEPRQQNDHVRVQNWNVQRGMRIVLGYQNLLELMLRTSQRYGDALRWNQNEEAHLPFPGCHWIALRLLCKHKQHNCVIVWSIPCHQHNHLTTAGVLRAPLHPSHAGLRELAWASLSSMGKNAQTVNRVLFDSDVCKVRLDEDQFLGGIVHFACI